MFTGGRNFHNKCKLPVIGYPNILYDFSKMYIKMYIANDDLKNTYMQKKSTIDYIEE